MFVITGATGKVGGGIAERLLAQGKKVRVIGRNREKLSPWESKGAQIALGSMDDADFLAKAFAGADTVFAMVPPDMQSPDVQAHYDRFGEAIAKAIAQSGVKSVVHLSSLGADMPKGNGPIAGLYRQEQRLNALKGVDVLHLRTGYFMENLFANIPMIKGMGINGSAMRSDVKMNLIATKDIAAYAAKRIVDKDFSGKSVQELQGQRDASMQEATAALGKAIGKPELPYVQFPYEDALNAMVGAGLSHSMAENFIEMTRAFNDGLVARAPRSAANSTPTSIEDFAAGFAQVFRNS